MNCFSQAWKDFGLPISLKKTNVLGQDTETPPLITIDECELDAVQQFTYLGSTVTDNLSLDTELNRRIGKSATTLARLTTRVCTKLTRRTKMAVYSACFISTLLYASETWTTYAKQDRRLNTFHMRSLSHILGISWQDRVINAEVLSRAGLPTLYTLLRQRRLRWLGHVHRMDDGRIPKDILYGELASGRRSTDRSQLRYKDVVKRDMNALDINTATWEDTAADSATWRSTLKQHLKAGEGKLMNATADKRAFRNERSASDKTQTTYKCDLCGRDCYSHIGLYSHIRRCSNRAT